MPCSRRWPSASPSGCASSTRGRHPASATGRCSGARSPSSRSARSLVFSVLGLHREWWRYFSCRDFWPLFRGVAVASALVVGVFALAQALLVRPARARSSSTTSCSPSCCIGGARLATRMIAERPDAGHARRERRGVLVVGAGSGGQMVVRELQLNPNLGARAIGFVDDDPRKRGMRALGLRVLGSTDEIGDDPRPQRARRGGDRDPVGARDAARQGRARLPRARHPGAHAADRVRAAARRRPAHPPAARGAGWRTCWAASRW